jgi:hydrogenase large subunit
MGTPVERANEPVEILRTLHSFDPCLACSTHVMSEDGEELINVTIALTINATLSINITTTW